jgi:hypothetical protein
MNWEEPSLRMWLNSPLVEIVSAHRFIAFGLMDEDSIVGALLIRL